MEAKYIRELKHDVEEYQVILVNPVNKDIYVLGNTDRMIRINRFTEQGDLICVVSEIDDEEHCLACCFSIDGKELFVANNRLIIVYDTTSRKSLKELRSWEYPSDEGQFPWMRPGESLYDIHSMAMYKDMLVMNRVLCTDRTQGDRIPTWILCASSRDGAVCAPPRNWNMDFGRVQLNRLTIYQDHLWCLHHAESAGILNTLHHTRKHAISRGTDSRPHDMTTISNDQELVVTTIQDDNKGGMLRVYRGTQLYGVVATLPPQCGSPVINAVAGIRDRHIAVQCKDSVHILRLWFPGLVSFCFNFAGRHRCSVRAQLRSIARSPLFDRQILRYIFGCLRGLRMPTRAEASSK